MPTEDEYHKDMRERLEAVEKKVEAILRGLAKKSKSKPKE